jgi:small-conductance mechanosensitive channel
VIVEDEWGWIEEINLTYVVVKMWDERRLVVPISRFLDNPFQNWTKVSPELLGTVFFHADYGLPIDDVRRELARILEDHPKWDRRAQGVVITDARDRTLEIRALVSAKDAGDQWDLRCDVREKLVAWLRRHEGGRYLPRLRVDGGSEATAPAAAAEGSRDR